MRIFVAGAGGVIGRRLVPQLVERGHQVVATTRDAARKDKLRVLGATPAVMDCLDPASVGEAVARAEPACGGRTTCSPPPMRSASIDSLPRERAQHHQPCQAPPSRPARRHPRCDAREPPPGLSAGAVSPRQGRARPAPAGPWRSAGRRRRRVAARGPGRGRALSR